MKKLVSQLAVVAGVLACGSSAFAIPTLTISDGTTTIVVQDGGMGDSSPVAGEVTWAGTIGAWTLNLDSGTTYPALGSPTSPDLELGFKANHTGGVGSLFITFSQVGFSYVGGLLDSLGGTTPDGVTKVTDRVFVGGSFDATTGAFIAPGSALITQGPLFGGTTFSATSSALVNLTPTDILSVQIQIASSTTGITTGDKDVKVVPDGGTTVALLGFAFVGAETLRRKLRK